jgi:manganese efflux pump family protein
MLSIFFIGVALSMDAFSVAISMGTQPLTKLKTILIPFIVGIFHFFMPLIGVFLGSQIISIFHFNSKILITIILLYLALVMFLDRNKTEKKLISSFISILLFAFSVSLDSFSVGLGLYGITSKIYASSLMFAVCSGTITYMGLILGKYSLKILKEKSQILGVIILIVIALVNLCQIIWN